MPSAPVCPAALLPLPINQNSSRILSAMPQLFGRSQRPRTRCLIVNPDCLLHFLGKDLRALHPHPSQPVEKHLIKALHKADGRMMIWRRILQNNAHSLARCLQLSSSGRLSDIYTQYLGTPHILTHLLNPTIISLPPTPLNPNPVP